MIKKLAVFCGSNIGNSPIFEEAAKELADVLSQGKITLIYGGAKVGLMGALADQMIKNGADVIGVIPQSLVDVEIAHPGVREMRVVKNMHERKTLMAELADGFLMLPGGPGSLEEFFEVLTWGQLGYHSKPCGILNIAAYYDKLLAFLDHAVDQAFFRPAHRNMIIIEQSLTSLISRFMDYQAPVEKKWIANA